MTLKNNRLEVVDALRGIALCAIVLIHSLEHYNLYFTPKGYPDWLYALDSGVWDTTWFLLAGKAFSTFSLLFGFSFFIQLDNAQKRGVPFRGRFLWRLFLLMLFSGLHSIFYNGDILFMYSIMGLILVAMCKCSTKTVLITATILILQPLEILRFILASTGVDFIEYGRHWVPYMREVTPIMTGGNYLETIHSNITDGWMFSNLWQIENGRVFQISALFLFGMAAGRLQLFVNSPKSKQVWKKLLLCSIVLYIPFYILKLYYPEWLEGNPKMATPADIAIPSIVNFLMTVVLVSIFTLAWFHKGNGYKFQRLFAPYGRMSLTNYIVQSIIGVAIFYNCGLGLYEYTGATLSLLIGVAIFTLQLLYTRWWLAHHKQGPLEFLWKKGTWLFGKVK